MSEISGGDLGRTPQDETLRQFDDANQALTQAVQEVPAYFDRPLVIPRSLEVNGTRYSPQSRGEWAALELAAIREKFAAGELTSQERATLYFGSHSEMPDYPDAIAGQQAMTSLWRAFQHVTHPDAPPAKYSDIKSKALLARDFGQTVVRSDITRQSIGVMPEDTLAGSSVAVLSGEGELMGLQLKVSPNLCVNFLLGHMNAASPASHGTKMSYVELLCDPPTSKAGPA